jgi:hypothetical protein
MAIGRDCGEQAGFAAGLLAGTIGSSDALSERGIAALVRLRGKRRVGGCAGSIISSNVAFRGSTPDPTTAIRAVAGSGVDALPDGDRSLKHHFSLRKVAPPASCRGASDLGQLRTRRPIVLDRAMASSTLPCWRFANLRPAFRSKKDRQLQAIRRWAVLGSNQ